MFNDNKLKLGIFSANCSSGMAVTKVSERWDNSWANNIDLVRQCDDAGLEFMLPIARWIGYGGETNHNGSNFETIAWASGLLAATKNIMAFGTVHVTAHSPAVAAKQMVTADHIGGGRFGLNIVCGWYQKEFDMLGVDLGEHELIGIWVIKEVDGGTGPRKQPGAAIEFTRDALFMVQLGDQPARAKMADLAQMNTEAEPKHIDFRRQDTLGYSVYELDGDKLTLSMRNPGQKRPASLKASPGGMVFHLVRQRELDKHKTL